MKQKPMERIEAQTAESYMDEAYRQLMEGRHHDPFALLGCHRQQGVATLRSFMPRTARIELVEKNGAELQRLGDTDLFIWQGPEAQLPEHPRLRRTSSDGHVHEYVEPYSFGPQLPDFDLDLFSAGKHLHIYRHLGAHLCTVDGIEGVLFATWAPNAERVSVVGNFNQWDGRVHPMRSRGNSGVWELFIPGLGVDEAYKFEIRNRASGAVLEKADPYAQASELRPRTASQVNHSDYAWQDEAWMQQRREYDWQHQPISVYEVHLGSWQQDGEGHFLDYRELAHRLVAHAKHLGFTHLELLPVTEHPLDDSWGYQTTGYFTPTKRYGSPDGFRYFVDHCHQNGIGVYLDWVPAHFPKDAHGLARFDGSALYEHEDPRRGEHPDWGTLIYNYGRNEVKNFLLSSAVYWLQEFHIDGLRVDAVASMLYLDYSREPHEWEPNYHGGNENLDAIEFLRELNAVVHGEFPGAVVVAEESTAWPAVTRPLELGGLGFSMKWNMGWMHDSLDFMSHEPIHRSYHHDQLTFGLLYLFTENFVLPFSHDEVVHGKGSMLYKMPGDEWQRFANLRLLYAYMFTYPGKKLLFMGCEFGQGDEWNFRKALDWYVLDYPLHRGLFNLVADLNHLYRDHNELHQHDFEAEGFEWIDCHDSQQSILAYMRKSSAGYKIVVLNFTPMPRHGYRIGVPQAGRYKEVLNTDSDYYGGSNVGNSGVVESETLGWMGRPHSLQLTLPPLGALVLEYMAE